MSSLVKLLPKFIIPNRARPEIRTVPTYLIIASITISTDILHYLYMYLWSASTCQTYFLHRAYDLQMSSDILFLILLFKNEFRQQDC